MNSAEVEELYENKERPHGHKARHASSPKKSKHKHLYEPIIIRYTYDKSILKGKSYQSGGKRCTICGRLDYGFPSEFSRTIVEPYLKERHPGNDLMFDSSYADNNPDHLDVVDVADIMKLNK